jgi:hypothetical protein
VAVGEDPVVVLAAEFPVMRQVPDHAAAAGVTRAIPRAGRAVPGRVRTRGEHLRRARG